MINIIGLGLIIQSCSPDAVDSFVDEQKTDAIYFEKINSIQSQDIQIVFNSIFQSLEKMEGGSSIYLKVCNDLVTDLNAISNAEISVETESFPRLKSVNPETVAAGWTYLGEVANHYIKGPADAIKLFNKYKDEWNYSCLEMRLETEEKVINVYARICQ